MARNPHRTDENGHLIVMSNDEKCRDCGGDDRNIWYRDMEPDGVTVRSQYAQCYNCDPERGLYEAKEKKMEGFHFHEGGAPVELTVLRRKEFVLGRAKMQMASRGVVELSDGTVRTFSVRRDHNPDAHGNLKTVAEPLRQNFDDAVNGLREFESWWITEELPER